MPVFRMEGLRVGHLPVLFLKAERTGSGHPVILAVQKDGVICIQLHAYGEVTELRRVGLQIGRGQPGGHNGSLFAAQPNSFPHFDLPVLVSAGSRFGVGIDLRQIQVGIHMVHRFKVVVGNAQGRAVNVPHFLHSAGKGTRAAIKIGLFLCHAVIIVYRHGLENGLHGNPQPAAGQHLVPDGGQLRVLVVVHNGQLVATVPHKPLELVPVNGIQGSRNDLNNPQAPLAGVLVRLLHAPGIGGKSGGRVLFKGAERVTLHIQRHRGNLTGGMTLVVTVQRVDPILIFVQALLRPAAVPRQRNYLNTQGIHTLQHIRQLLHLKIGRGDVLIHPVDFIGGQHVR
ncbi:hypothetical protein [Oscillibacter sp.]|uniref:hypothetical protein n=1 Tax=Oscillibacter sp. TaxID=1945593 RepID=UPI002D7FBB70|nr:hypothetical protein [Oscillibacter sp.]